MSAPCGTRAAYQRHRRRGEPIDDQCKAAAAAEARARRAAGKTTPKVPQPKPVAAKAAPAALSVPKEEPRGPGNMPAEAYRVDPTAHTPDDLGDFEVPSPPWMKAIAIETARLQKEPAEPEVHRVQMAVVERGRIEGYADERFAPPNVVYEDLPPDVPESWIGPPPSMRRKHSRSYEAMMRRRDGH